jgi:hypothetical protein
VSFLHRQSNGRRDYEGLRWEKDRLLLWGRSKLARVILCAGEGSEIVGIFSLHQGNKLYIKLYKKNYFTTFILRFMIFLYTSSSECVLLLLFAQVNQ